MAERRFPVRIRIAVSPGGLGQRYCPNDRLARRELRSRRIGDDTVRARGVLNDAASIYFLDTTLAGALSPDGAPGPRSRRPAAYSRCARTSQRRGSGGADRTS
jgi:hypothetical protein